MKLWLQLTGRYKGLTRYTLHVQTCGLHGNSRHNPHWQQLLHCHYGCEGRRPLTFAYLKHTWPVRWKEVRSYRSTLFISNALEHSGQVEVDLDLEEKLADAEKLAENLKLRHIDMDIETVVADFKEMMKSSAEKSQLGEERERIAKKMAGLVKAQKVDKTKDLAGVKKQLIEKGRGVKEKLQALTKSSWELEERVMLTALTLPNDLWSSTPAKDTKVVQEFFTENKKSLSHSHLEILKQTEMVKFSNVGPRAYYLTGRLAELEQELSEYFTIRLRRAGFSQLSCPEMFRGPVVEGAGVDITDKNQVYRLQTREQDLEEGADVTTDRLFLRGSSALSFLGYFMRMILTESELPLQVFCSGRSYVPSVKDIEKLPGLYGALQTVKFDTCTVCRDRTELEDMFNKLREDLIHNYEAFKLPARLVAVSASSLERSEQYREELQIWVPSLKQYIKAASVSVTGDYSSRRLMIRCANANSHANTRPVHMIHSEIADLTRLMALLVEYGQTHQRLV